MSNPKEQKNISFDFSKYTDGELKRSAVWILGIVSIPMGNWFSVFSNPEPFFMERTNLRVKAFCVWFPTQIDFLEQEELIIKDLYEEFTIRSINISEVKELTTTLISLLKKVLDNFTKEEQLFLYDRRLQNTHGFLSMYFRGGGLKFFNTITKKIEIIRMSVNEYNSLQAKYYVNMNENSINLLNKFVSLSIDAHNLMSFYDNKIRPEHLTKIAKELSVHHEN